MMEKVRAVVVTAFLVECDREVDSERLRRLIRRVKDATKTFTDGEVSLIPSQAFNAFWLGSEKNLGRCTKCDNLTSDRSKPEFVGGVSEGNLGSNGSFVCQECLENK